MSPSRARIDGSITTRTRPVTAHYKPTDGLGILGRLQLWASDPARWLDYIWLLVASTVGFTLSVVAASLFLAIAWYAVFPFVFAVTPDGVFDTPLGFMTMDTQAESFLYWIPGVVFFGLWWFGVEPMIRLRARVDRGMLCNRTQRLEARGVTCPAPAPRQSTSLLRRSGGSSATCTTGRRPAWARSG